MSRKKISRIQSNEIRSTVMNPTIGMDVDPELRDFSNGMQLVRLD